MQKAFWLAGVLLVTLSACGQKQASDTTSSATDNTSIPGHVGSRADNTTPMTEPTPGNPTGITQHGGTGAPVRNDTGAAGTGSDMKAQGTNAQAPQH